MTNGGQAITVFPSELGSWLHSQWMETSIKIRRGSFVCSHREFTGDPSGHCLLDLGKSELTFPSLASPPFSAWGLPHLPALGWGWPMESLGHKKRRRRERGGIYPCSLSSPCGQCLSRLPPPQGPTFLPLLLTVLTAAGKGGPAPLGSFQRKNEGPWEA